MNKLIPILVALATCLLLPLSAQAQVDRPLEPEKAFRVSLAHDAFGGLRFDWEIEEGYYVYRGLISAEREKTGERLPIETQPGIPKSDLNFGEVEVYYGTASALLMEPEEDPLLLTYQGCRENSICYPPVTLRADPATLKLSPVSDGHPGTGEKDGTDDGIFMLAEGTGMVDSLLAKGGAPWAVASFFVFGLLLAFTPCVFPMYPIVVGLLSREGNALTVARGFLLTAAYSVSLAAAFGIAGAAAGWTGGNLQMALQSPYAAVAATTAFIALGLSCLGLFHLNLPSAWVSRISRQTSGRHSGIASAAALGFSSALVVGPCVTAPLAGALIYVMQTGDAALGGAALFALGLGKSAPLVALGTLGGGALPRVGAWMATVKKAFGLGFFAAAAWMAWPLVAPTSSASVNWAKAATVEAVASHLAAADRPVLVYFTASWCVECTTVERSVLPDGQVLAALAGFRLVKADVTDYGHEAAELMRQMKVAGPPTMVFFGPDSREVPGTRIVGGITVRAVVKSAGKAGLLH